MFGDFDWGIFLSADPQFGWRLLMYNHFQAFGFDCWVHVDAPVLSRLHALGQSLIRSLFSLLLASLPV